MEHFWNILTGAPWWVYLLLIYLVSLGIKSIKPRTISIKRLILFPLVFIAWSFYGLYEKLTLGFPWLALYWIVFLAVGTYFGIREVCHWHLKITHSKEEITIPGNYSTLILILLIFILKFSWGYFYATWETIPYWLYVADTTSSSLVTGFFVGRALFFHAHAR